MSNKLVRKGKMKLVRGDGRTYLSRRRISTPWFRIFLHKMEAPDPGDHLHDHPWPFFSIILWGGYMEQREDTRTASERADGVLFGRTETYGDCKKHNIFGVNRMPLNTAHRICALDREGTWTLVFAGRRVRDWGFYTESGWCVHDEYNSELDRGGLTLEGTDEDG